MEKIESHNPDLNMFLDKDCLNFCLKRAGNPKSPAPCEKVPSSISHLVHASPGTGHDVALSGMIVYFDWNINKIIREHLLRYSHVTPISSCSLMHNFQELVKRDESLPSSVKEVDDVPLGFKYYMTFYTNYRQLKIIYQQRKNHKRKEWKDFCNSLKYLPYSTIITGRE